jgi:hypothetical protein
MISGATMKEARARVSRSKNDHNQCDSESLLQGVRQRSRTGELDLLDVIGDTGDQPSVECV